MHGAEVQLAKRSESNNMVLANMKDLEHSLYQGFNQHEQFETPIIRDSEYHVQLFGEHVPEMIEQSLFTWIMKFVCHFINR